MGTRITFENAVLLDAVQKGSRVAPTKGAAYDKAQGFHITVDVQSRSITLSATNLEVTFKMKVPAMSASGDNAVWRVPSATLYGIVAGLPTTPDASTEFVDRGDGKIRLKSGHTAVALNMIEGEAYPIPPDYTHEGMAPGQALSGRVEQVSWSVDSTGSGPMTGIRLTGTHLVGVNPYGLAMVPCEVALPEPVTVPLELITPLIKNASDVKMKADGERFVVALDSETLVTTQLVQGEFVQYERVLRDNFAALVTVRRQSFIDCLNQILALVKTDRQPTVKLTLDCGGIVSMLRMDAEVDQVGRMQTGLDVGTDYQGDPIELFFKPSTLVDATEHAKGDMVTFGMGVDTDPHKMHSLCVKDNGGYVCYVMPFKQTQGAS